MPIKEKSIQRKRIVFLILSLLWMGLIFSLSAQNADTSSETSGRFVNLVQKIFFSDWVELSEEELASQMGALSLLIRKMAHFTAYLILGGFLAGFTSTFPGKWLYRFLVAFIVGVCYAGSDEFHQLFVDGRSMQLFDVLIDSAGVFLGCLVSLGLSAMTILERIEKQIDKMS